MEQHLPEILILLGTIFGLYAVTVWFLFRGASEDAPPKPEPVTVTPPAVPTPAPVLLTPKPQKVGLRLVSAKGRALMAQPVVIEAKNRRPVYRHRTKDGHVSVFVADRLGDDGIWIYRRVSVEREA